MPSGFTHILLAKTFADKTGLKDHQLGWILDSNMHYFQLGALGPDLPYSQLLTSPLNGKEESEPANKFHYENTNEIPVKAFDRIKGLDETESKDQLFAFFLGFAAHVVADGIIHPYVRDKVGDYEDNKNEHRKLEMRLDVLFLHDLTKNSGKPINLNDTNLHDQIRDALSDFSHISNLFSELIKEIYALEVTPNKIEKWVHDMHKVFEMAESSNNRYYSFMPGAGGYLFKDDEEVLRNHQDDLILKMNEAKKRDMNFAGRDIHFINDCIPSFYSAFKKVAITAFEYVYGNGNKLSHSDFPAINLDTGRPLIASKGTDLSADASFWGLA